MSKIIVDQVQKNGGDVLTLPATDATANNQPLVGATNGNLTFSPLALPAADGTANKPVTTDGSGQLQFGAFPIPSTAGNNGQFLKSNGTAAEWGAGPAGIALEVPDDVVGTVVTGSARGNSYSSGAWTTSDGPNGNHYGNNAFGSSNVDETWNMFLGDGYPDGSNTHMYTVSHAGLPHREMQFANNKRVGHSYKNHYYYQNQTSYGGFYVRIMPIRNISSAAINVPIYAYASSYSNSYSGCSWGYFTPTNSSGTLYSTVTGGAWTNVASYASSNINYNIAGGQNVSVPAGKTVLVGLFSSTAYQTTYIFMDTNQFYGLDNTFSNANIVCDMRMLTALQQGRSTGNTNAIGSPHEIYNACATLFGDR